MSNGLPKGYVPLAHAVFDRVVAETGSANLVALLDEGVRPAPVADPEDFGRFVDATSTEAFSFYSVSVDTADREYCYRWLSRHATVDNDERLVRRPDRHFHVMPWGPFEMLPFREHGDEHHRLMYKAAQTWNEQAAGVLAKLVGQDPLYGRVGSWSSVHQAIDWDIWNLVRIEEWGTGIAVSDDSSVTIRSLHAPGVSRSAARMGRPSKRAAVIAAIRKARPDGDYSIHKRLQEEVAHILGLKAFPLSSLKAALKDIHDELS